MIIIAGGLIQPIFFENALTSKFKSIVMLLERCFVSPENERLWIHSGLRKIRFYQRRPLEKSPVGTDGTEDSKFCSFIRVLYPE